MHKLDRTSAPVPACLANYRPRGNTWDDVSTADKATIRASLKVMQGTRCAYCEVSIDNKDYHIEHFRRKRDFPHLTFDWSNLLLCCDQRDCCGHHKDRHGSPYDIHDLIDPTNEQPDDYFWFLESGVIEVRGGHDVAQARRASETLRVLNLSDHHGRLRHMRARQLKWYKNMNPDVFEELENWPDPDLSEYVQGELAATASQPFCTIIRHFLQDLVR
jgi:uncharacterized protein (TIGR02646 family)